MKNKPPAHGSPWSRIDEVELFLTERIDELERNMKIIDGRVAKLETKPKPRKRAS